MFIFLLVSVSFFTLLYRRLLFFSFVLRLPPVISLSLLSLAFILQVKHLLEEKLIDMVAIDVKTSLQNQEAYDRICGAHVPLAGVRETIDMVAKSGVCYQLRTTVVPALHTPTDLEDIAKQIPAGAQWKQQKFIPENALDESLRTPKQMADA